MKIKDQLRVVACALFITIVVASCNAGDKGFGYANKSVKTDGNYLKSKALSDTLPSLKSDVRDIYIQAIKDYISAIKKKDQTIFDTLFFVDRQWQAPDDFPDLRLPEQIDGVVIRLISNDGKNPQKLNCTKLTPMINLMGWIEVDKAEFIFVAFYPEFKHQFDCYLNYDLNSNDKNISLKKLTIEVLNYDANGKPKHYDVYENNLLVGQKAVK